MLNVYRPIPRDLFSATLPVGSRRALRFFMSWYDAIAGVFILTIMALLVAPVATRTPLLLLWPLVYLAYISGIVALSRIPTLRGVVRTSANATSHWLTWLVYGPQDAHSTDDDSPGALAAFHVVLAIVLTAAAFLFVVTLDSAYRAAGLPLSADVASWLLFVLPLLRVARYASMVWIGLLGALVILCDGAAQLFALGPADLTAVRVVALHACWLALVSLLPAITLRSLSERRAELASAIEVVRAITALRTSTEREFANEAAALIAQRLGYDEVNVLLATSDDERTWRGLRFLGAASPAGRALAENGFVVSEERSITGWAAVYGQELLVNDVERDPDHRYLRHASFPRTQAELAIPLTLGDTVVGVLDVQSERALTFGEDDVELLRAIALHLALSLDNQQQLTRARGLASVTHRIARRLLSRQDLRAALEQVVNIARDTLRADSVALYPRDPETDEIGEPVLAGVFETKPASAARVAQRRADSAVARALRDGQRRFVRYSEQPEGPGADFVAREKVQSAAILPLRVGERDGASEAGALGVIFVNYQSQQRFSPEYQEWCAALADLAALALQSAMLYQQVVEEERANTWTELHDGMGQDVSYGRMLLEQVMTTWTTTGALAPIDGEKLRNAYQFVHALQRQVNYLLDIWRERDASELWGAGESETAADGCGFFADLEEHATLVQRSLEIRCLVRRVGDDAALPASLRHDARMIAREAVYNAYRHGRASEVTIDAVVDEDTLRLTIRDNGLGFDTRRLSTKAHGMSNIHRRADRHHGDVTLESSREPGNSGTTVSVIFRLAPDTSPRLARVERRLTAQDSANGTMSPQNFVDMPMFVAAPTSVGEGERYDG